MFRLLILLLPVAAFVPTALAFVANTRSRNAAALYHRRQHEPLQAFLGDNAAAVIDDFYQTQPYLAAFMTCSFKASAADFVAQTRQQQQQQTLLTGKYKGQILSQQTNDDDDAQQVDLFRNLGFVFYGGLYQGMAQQFLFNDLYPSFFPQLTGWQNVAAQVTLDMTVVSPFVCLPLAYVFKALFTNEGGNSNTNNKLVPVTTANESTSVTDDITAFASTATTSVMAGLEKYVYDVRYQQLLFKYWALWIPVQSMTFGVIPPQYRVAFVAAVSFFWVFVLSTIAAATKEEVTETKSSS